jgi:hypothetical protein
MWTKITTTPEEETVDLEGKDVKDGQEGTALSKCKMMCEWL